MNLICFHKNSASKCYCARLYDVLKPNQDRDAKLASSQDGNLPGQAVGNIASDACFELGIDGDTRRGAPAEYNSGNVAVEVGQGDDGILPFHM